MKAAVYYKNGPPSVLQYEDVPDPRIFDDGILVENKVISIEGGDTLNRLRGDLAAEPHIVGYQSAGVVLEVGKNVSGFAPGDQVVCINFHGSHAEQRLTLPQTAWKIPSGMDMKHAAAVPIPFGTADDCLFEFGRLKAGETALIQAGASAVGIAAIQLAKRAGATVIATASSEAKLERLKAFGLDHGINYVEQDLVEESKKLTGGRGVDVVVDPVGGPTLQQSIYALGYRGRVSTVGDAGREFIKFDLSTLREGNRTITGVFQGAEIFTDRMYNLVAGHLAAVAKGELKVVIDSEYALKDAAAAHAHIEDRNAFGRVLLIP
ncbi:zinc-binding alcohol dehydrogenase family protein [Pyruvatibacter sp.]|uniref:quinone oxidoreductase family protein n=1 Tax=Pyruvatibacter sp. TaxID=1981328 RepID=UPI0032EC8550